MLWRVVPLLLNVAAVIASVAAHLPKTSEFDMGQRLRDLSELREAILGHGFKDNTAHVQSILDRMHLNDLAGDHPAESFFALEVRFESFMTTDFSEILKILAQSMTARQVAKPFLIQTSRDGDVKSALHHLWDRATRVPQNTILLTEVEVLAAHTTAADISNVVEHALYKFRKNRPTTDSYIYRQGVIGTPSPYPQYWISKPNELNAMAPLVRHGKLTQETLSIILDMALTMQNQPLVEEVLRYEIRSVHSYLLSGMARYAVYQHRITHHMFKLLHQTQDFYSQHLHAPYFPFLEHCQAIYDHLLEETMSYEKEMSDRWRKVASLKADPINSFRMRLMQTLKHWDFAEDD